MACLKILSRKLLPAHWLENRDDQPRTVGVSNYIQVDAIINIGYFKKDPSPVAAGQRHFLVLIYVVVRHVEALTFFLWKVFFVVVLTFNCVSFDCHIIS